MTDIIEPHGPQGSTTETSGRRPWQAPRLIDLDELDAEHCRGGVGGNFKPRGNTEVNDPGNKCSFLGDPALLVAS